MFLILDNTCKILNHAIIEDYVPFIITLFTLYLLSHGIHIKIKLSSGTKQNALFLIIASIFSSIIGTTGASMLLLRPFLEMNKNRQKKTHLLVFFIFLVSNIGGLLTPLGDPPLLLGYLHGIEFSWFFKNLVFYWLLYIFTCVLIMVFVDKHIIKNEKNIKVDEKFELKITGIGNIFLTILTVFVLFIDFDFVNKSNIPQIYLKCSLLLIFCLISFVYSKKVNHEKIDFAPFSEVAKTFLVIFIVIAPVLHILETNSHIIHEYIRNISKGSDESIVYFWLCSLTSSFLDNAPSYLLFFNMAGGNANELMNVYPNILQAISISAVVMGAMTYIGNAPNMMVRSIALKKGIKMPSFIGYILWSCLVILPISFFISFILYK
jgi:Na+/H+ antiporter NhaD/arsenite permease-like protein